jgi:meso-butanediol dehydrogenase/(S,S)-butanediol dehydrogenase/diacetyl reductase
VISSLTYPYDDTVVLVTGAGDGIGRAVARAFAEQGARVVGLGRHVETVADALSGFDEDRTLALQADVSQRADVEGAVAAAVERFGRLDVVVPNAAVFETADLLDLTDEQWRLLQSVNVDGLFYLLQATVPHLKASHGNVVAISSVSGMRGDWGQFAYNATKGAGVTMLQSLALDLGPDGVRVNMVAPAFTVTRITEGATRSPGFEDAIRNRVTLGRPGQPDDVARAVLFLASPDAGYITGALLPVDGGTTASTGQIHS